ncbi:Uma2 family endonuclease [Archangium lansingense]|uniref:Uma2 family endonuclease n=1 Tax=Archangium lansingense TaxID=2995310 RepID=A0ABT4AL12_9BACT|nr:Uma2 family endonuclease [Archangium lansinium]MCY1081502.1 Uma2 family endonuclease [Archangium lansinium]
MHIMRIGPYRIDPDDPRAPSQEVWERLTPEERARIVEGLPSEFPVSEAAPPEGDPHFVAKVETRQVLGDFFTRAGRKVYLACELPVYYPGERMFAPDVIAVLGVESHERMRWVVSAEGKGLDFALEIHVAGDRRKDLERNVKRFARLGIREYFLFDRGRLRLNGWRLEEGRRGYDAILPQQGFFASEVLGLELRVDGERLRFHHDRVPLPAADEMIAMLERRARESEVQLARESQVRAELEHRLAEEARLRAEEARRREESDHRLAEALAELARLRGDPG